MSTCTSVFWLGVGVASVMWIFALVLAAVRLSGLISQEERAP